MGTPQRWPATWRAAARKPIRRLLIFALALSSLSPAWDTLPHQAITKAALDTFPNPFGPAAEPLVRIYCMYPDRYLEMERYGFVRKNGGPQNTNEIHTYCVRPGGPPIHGLTDDRESDLQSLVYLAERTVTSLSENRPEEAAKFAGVLAHFIEDSASLPHAGDVDLPLHARIERSAPAFTLGDRKPKVLSPHIVATAEAVLSRCSEEAERNRRDLPVIIRAARAGDEVTLDRYRLRAAKAAAAILADALFTLFEIASS